jgi:hypothetical protein
MRDILDVIVSRKSIRRYKPDPVPDEMIDKILEAARWAPTGENYQPWKFIVIRDPETKNRIGDLAKVGSGSRMTAWYCLGQMQKRFEKIKDPAKRAEVLRFMYSGEVSEFAKHAPVIIVVLGDLQMGSVDVGGHGEHTPGGALAGIGCLLGARSGGNLPGCHQIQKDLRDPVRHGCVQSDLLRRHRMAAGAAQAPKAQVCA